jgi:hypothetical protein
MRAKWKLSKVPPGHIYDPVTRERDPDRDPQHLAFLRSLPCAVLAHPLPGATRCRYGVEAHHPTGAGMALRDGDTRAFSLCHGHHMEFHDLRGTFRGWTKAQRRDWQERMSDAYARKPHNTGTFLGAEAGQVYGRITLTGGVKREGAYTLVEGECACKTRRWFRLSRLREGKVTSCGCWRKERTAVLKLGTTHGLSQTAEHSAWAHMKARCYNPKAQRYKRYGARGIYVCAAWKDDFEQFFRDVGARPSTAHSIDRIDNDGSYTCGKCPECISRQAKANCRWGTRAEQVASRSTTEYYDYRGERRQLGELAKTHGLTKAAVRARLKAGWTLHTALITPVQKRTRLGALRREL